MSERYEKARAIAEAAANHWGRFGDTAGVQWLAEQIHRAIAAEAPPNDGHLCKCNIGQCHFLTERCREMATGTNQTATSGEALTGKERMSETLIYEDSWLPMDEAPVAEPVEVRAGGMRFKAVLVPYGALDTNENPCDQWQATAEGEHPPCWSDGCCWTVNENEDRSAWPEAWRPLSSPTSEP